MTEDNNTIENKQPDAPQIKMPDESQLYVSSSPHLHDKCSVQKIMLLVIIALIPGCLTGLYFFGIDALKVMVYCMVFCVGVEFIWRWIAGENTDTWKDLSAVVTGIILAMNLSAGVPWWLCLVGAVLAIALGKQIYGGLGHNPFNPAIVARVGLLIGFPKLMTTWVPTRFMPGEAAYNKMMVYDEKVMNAAGVTVEAVKSKAIPFFTSVYDGVTCATPLGTMKTADEVAAATGKSTAAVLNEISNASIYWDYFWGNVGGCLGETSVIALLIGGIFLIALKIIRWQVPVSYIGTVVVFTSIVHFFAPDMTPNALFHVLTGGLMLGAFFCATDMVTSPMTGLGAFIFGTGCGVMTCLIRIWGNYPEGVSFSILFMNAWVPLIDRLTKKRPFGYRIPQGDKK